MVADDLLLDVYNGGGCVDGAEDEEYGWIWDVGVFS